jgi:heteromeric Ino2p/Ino4p transcription factor
MAKPKPQSQATTPARSRSQSQSPSSSHSASATPSARKTVKLSSSSNSASKPRLTAHQKNTNHKDAENKRRNAIREQFTELASLVPGAEGLERSENVMLQKTIAHFREEVDERRRMVGVLQGRGTVVPKELVFGEDQWGGMRFKTGNLEEFETARRKRIEKEGGDVDAGEESLMS